VEEQREKEEEEEEEHTLRRITKNISLPRNFYYFT